MEPAAGITVSENGGLSFEQTAPSERGDNVITPPNFRQPTDLSIYCIYSAYPSELVVNSTRWFKDGKQLNVKRFSKLDPTNVSQQQLHHLSETTTATGYPVLTIRQVSRLDAGLYDCQVANSVGTSERLPASESCKVVVNFRPSVQIGLYKAPLGASMRAPDSSYPMEELSELDPTKDLILPGASFVLVCQVLEAQPDKIQKFHWFKRQPTSAQARAELIPTMGQLVSITETNQLVLSSLAANFTPATFTCLAFNQIGPSEQSNQVEIQLSYAPGKCQTSRAKTNNCLLNPAKGERVLQRYTLEGRVCDCLPCWLCGQWPLASQ